jgi:hypothetical protein
VFGGGQVFGFFQKLKKLRENEKASGSRLERQINKSVPFFVDPHTHTYEYGPGLGSNGKHTRVNQ